MHDWLSWFKLSLTKAVTIHELVKVYPPHTLSETYTDTQINACYLSLASGISFIMVSQTFLRTFWLASSHPPQDFLKLLKIIVNHQFKRRPQGLHPSPLFFLDCFPPCPSESWLIIKFVPAPILKWTILVWNTVTFEQIADSPLLILIAAIV